MFDPASITAGVTVLTSAVGVALGSVTVNASLSAIGGGLAGNTAMEFAKAACRKGGDSVGLLRDHLTRLDLRENHILLRAMVVAYWQSIAQVAEQHRKLLNLSRSDGGGPLLDLIDACDARRELAKAASPAMLSKDEWKSAIEGAYADLTALVAQDMKGPASASAREGPATLAWEALHAEFPEAAETLAFERSFFENWFYAFTVNFQFAATKDAQVRDLLLLRLFSEIPSRNGGEVLKPEAILNAFEQLGDAIRRELAGVRTAIDALHTDIGHRLADLRADVLTPFKELKACEPSLQIGRPRKLTRDRIDLLLRPHNVFIEFSGREAELGALDAFCDHPATFRWKVLTGDGGVGKTRLALQLAKCRETSWRAGFLDAESLRSWARNDRFQTWAPTIDTLIVIDYAANKSEDLKRLLKRCGQWAGEHTGELRLRLLLLEREADRGSGWLHGLLSDAEGPLRDDIRGALEPLQEIKAPGGRNPDAAIEAVLRATFKAWSELADDSASPPFPALDAAALGELRRRTEGRPLFLQMAAIRACDENDTSNLTRWDRDDLLTYAVERERRYVNQRFGADSTRARLVERGIAFLTFTGPISTGYSNWLKLLAADAESQGLPRTQPGEVSEDVAALLGESQDDNVSRILPLSPDLLAEALAVKVFNERSGSPVWALEASLQCAGPIAWVHLLRATIDLYGSTRFGIIEMWLLSLVPGRTAPELAVVDRMIPKSTVALRRIAIAIGESRLRALPAGQESDGTKAGILHDLALRYRGQGRIEEALAAAEQALKIREWLAKQGTHVFERALASNLNDLGILYGQLGSEGKGLAAAEQAVEISQRGAKENPYDFEPLLATSLNNLGTLYMKLGKREEALEAVKRAVEIQERLAKQYPYTFEPNLALSLNNLGIHYSELGMLDEGLEVAKRTVEINKQLAQRDSDAYEPDLASSLANLGKHYNSLGRPEDALEATERAVEIFQRLAKQNPEGFEPDLAQSFDNLANRYHRLGRTEKALEATKQRLEILQRLAKRNPDAFEPELADSLCKLVASYTEMGRLEEALVAAERAVATCQRLVKQNPDGFGPCLALSLGVLTRIWREQNPVEATNSFRRGIEILRPAFLRRPTEYRDLMGAFLKYYVNACQRSGQDLERELVISMTETLMNLPPDN